MTRVCLALMMTGLTLVLAAPGAGAAGGLASTPATGVALPGPEAYSGAEVAQPRYGLLPFLRKSIWWRSNAGACAGCEPQGKHFGHGGNGFGHAGGQQGGGGFPGQGVPGVPQPGQPGAGMPGTLVFPNHPFARSPRDFFMYER